MNISYDVVREEDYWCSRRNRWIRGAVKFRDALIECTDDEFDFADRVVDELIDMGWRFEGWCGDIDYNCGQFPVDDKYEYNDLKEDYKEIKKRLKGAR